MLVNVGLDEIEKNLDQRVQPGYSTRLHEIHRVPECNTAVLQIYRAASIKTVDIEVPPVL
jgi:hypothetical protein